MATTKKPGDQAKTTKPGSSTSKPGTGTSTRPSVPPVINNGQPSRPSAPVRTTTAAPAATPVVTPKSGQSPTFTLTQAQKNQLKNMPVDAAERQIAIWREEWRIAEAKKASYRVGPQIPTTTATDQTTPTPTSQPDGVTPQITSTEPVVPVDWEEAAKELYGGYFAVIQSVPELQELLRKAVGPPAWSEAKFEYELKQTSWWKQNSSTARDWDLSSQLDPATAQQQVDNLASRLRNMSLTEFGVQLDETQLQKLARDSLRFGWSEQMVKNAIGLEATRSGQGVGQLASGFLGQGLKATANAYGLKLSDDMLNRWTSAIATGQETKERFQQYAVNTAKNLFPAISAQLDTGLTFQDIVDPFRNVAAQILEINPESIDFIDPKFARAISNVDQSGQQRMMSFSEWGDYLRTERSFGYEYTSDAQQRAFKVGNDLANLFGRV